MGSTPCFIDKAVVPGDVVLDHSSMTNKRIKLGDGLQQDDDVVIVIKAGILKFSKPNKYWIESSLKRYIPTEGNTVLGIVVDRRADSFFVDIKGPMMAFLPVLAFEGGNRRNIPKLEVGTLVYTRIVKAKTGTNPELSCIDASGKTARFGPHKDGYMFESSTGLSRMQLTSPTCPLLQRLRKKLAFEIVVGLNGRVWVNADQKSSIILVANAIINFESLTPGASQHYSCFIE